MSASAWDRAVESAARVIATGDAARFDLLNDSLRRWYLDRSRAVLADALPDLLDELASEVDALNFSGHPAQIRSKVLRIVRGFAAEVTKKAGP